MDWTSIINSLLSALIPALATVLAGWFAILGTKIKEKYEQKINTETAKAVVADVVQFVQQVYKDLDGPAKLQKAIEQATEILQNKGIKITEMEINMLIESSVFAMKQAFYEPYCEELPEELECDEEGNPDED